MKLILESISRESKVKTAKVSETHGRTYRYNAAKAENLKLIAEQASAENKTPKLT